MVAPSYESNTKVIEHNFAIAGHTKFGPDRGFALIKNALKKQAVFAPADLYHVVQSWSGRTNSAVCSTQYPFYDWKLFLSQVFQSQSKAYILATSLPIHFRECGGYADQDISGNGMEDNEALASWCIGGRCAERW